MMHKMALRHSQLIHQAAEGTENEIALTRQIFGFCSNFIMMARAGADPGLVMAVNALRAIVTKATISRWMADEHLCFLPAAVNNLLEYFVITSRILDTRSPDDVLELVKAIEDRVRAIRVSPSDSFRFVVQRVLSISNQLRSEAALASGQSHSLLIAEASELVRSPDRK